MYLNHILLRSQGFHFSSPACSGSILEITKICYFHINHVLVILKSSVFSVTIKSTKHNPKTTQHQHSQNSLLDLLLVPPSDSYGILTDFAMTLLVHSFFPSNLRHPGQFLMVSIAQIATNIGHSELRAEKQTR